MNRQYIHIKNIDEFKYLVECLRFEIDKNNHRSIKECLDKFPEIKDLYLETINTSYNLLLDRNIYYNYTIYKNRIDVIRDKKINDLLND